MVFEHQLDLLAQGSPASLLLNFALFFLGVAATSLGTLVTAPPQQDRIFYAFFILFIITLIAGIVILAIWYVMHRSVASLVIEIKAQMPPNHQWSKGHRDRLIQARRNCIAVSE